MHMYEKLKNKLCEELEKLSEKEISATNLEYVDKLTRSIKSIETIMAMEEAFDDDEEDYGRYGAGRGRGRAGRYNAGGGRNGREYRNMYPDYGRRNYGAGGRDQFVQQMHELMESAPDERTREAIRQAMRQMGNE